MQAFFNTFIHWVGCIFLSEKLWYLARDTLHRQIFLGGSASSTLCWGFGQHVSGILNLQNILARQGTMGYDEKGRSFLREGPEIV